MNLGGLFSSLGNESRSNLIENNKTILIVAVVALIIFGFGNGRSMFGDPDFGWPINYGEAAGYGVYNPGKAEMSERKKRKRRKDRRCDDYEEDYYDETTEGNTFENPEMTVHPGMEGQFYGSNKQGPGFNDVPPEMPYRPW